ncbi:hypothetical protein [Nonomuraea sp. NPDC046570]|uniref:DUF6461 domain-containing protein n=1 Tax=Nonomuraea sp. NPDC046570 TaxID=3155255 RepID=UPI003410D349
MNEAEEYYRDVVGYFDETMCVTWCEGLDLDEVAVVFGSGRDTGRRFDVIEAENEGFEAREVAGVACSAIAGALGSWVVVVEPTYGDTGSDHEILRDLSARGRAFNVYSGVNSHSLDYYVASRPVTILQFRELSDDPLIRQGDEPYLFGELADSFPGGRPSDFRAFALMLAEHVTRVRLTHDWLFDKHRWLLWEDLDDY